MNVTGNMSNNNDSPPLLHCSADSTHLSDAVRNAVETFLAHMGGHECTDLYELVLQEVEKPLLDCVMKDCDDNQSRAAKVLGISRGTLRTKLKRYQDKASG